MKMTQVAQLLNVMNPQFIGGEQILTEDLSNCIDIGKAVFSATSYDNYVKALVDHISRTIVSNRKAVGIAPSLYMDYSEYGGVVEKITVMAPAVAENKSWDLQDGVVYEQDTFTKPNVKVKFFGDGTTYEVPISITEMQVKSAFGGASQLAGFISGIWTAVENVLTISNDNMKMALLRTGIAMTLHAEHPNDDYSGTSVRAINLLKIYNDAHPGATITAADALSNPEFIRLMCFQMKQTADRMAVSNKLFNATGLTKFTPRESLNVFMLADAKNAADIYLQSNVFHDEFTALPQADALPFWQSPGESYSFAEVSDIHVKTPKGDTVEADGILCLMCDREAMGVTNFNSRVTMHNNGRAEFVNYWSKVDAKYFLDEDEQMVVFYVA